jgi:hypothetical protein
MRAWNIFGNVLDSNRVTKSRISNTFALHSMSWVSSVNIESDYKLDDWGSISAEAKDFSSSLCVQTSSEARPASYPVRTGARFTGGKAWPRHDADHSPRLVPRPRMGSFSSPTSRLHGGSGTLYFTFTLHCM